MAIADIMLTQLAQQLEAKGVRRVRWPLGGLAAWKELGYPLEDAADRIHWHGAVDTATKTG